MKATGIVRRIDELGRVVIPKEIRRTLRLKDGDPVEIFTEHDELMLKKYSPIASLEQFSEATARSLHQFSNLLALVSDTDCILYAAGDGKKYFSGKRISADFEQILRERRTHVAQKGSKDTIVPIVRDQECPVSAQIVVPIVLNGDCLGAITLVAFSGGDTVDAHTVKLCQLTAELVALQFE